MRFGAVISGTPDPAFSADMAALESAGLDSLWFGLDGTRWNPIVLASAAAMTTARVSLVVALSDPTPVTAKSIASLDALSRGRVEVLVDDVEAVALLRAMLAGEQVRYQGPRFTVVDAPVLPAPVQERIPLWTQTTELAPLVDGLLTARVQTTVDAARRAVLVDGERADLGSFVSTAAAAGIDEIVLRLQRSSWSLASRLLAEIK